MSKKWWGSCYQLFEFKIWFQTATSSPVPQNLKTGATRPQVIPGLKSSQVLGPKGMLDNASQGCSRPHHGASRARSADLAEVKSCGVWTPIFSKRETDRCEKPISSGLNTEEVLSIDDACNGSSTTGYSGVYIKIE